MSDEHEDTFNDFRSKVAINGDRDGLNGTRRRSLVDSEDGDSEEDDTEATRR